MKVKKSEEKIVEEELQKKAETIYKRGRNAPCVFPGPDPRTGRIRDYYPAVSCAGHCDFCGWNPEVRKKRVAKMLAELEARQKAEAKAARKAKKGAKK